ncbi:MAG TPA: hypothetical protein VIN06_12940 [Devosia sp.]
MNSITKIVGGALAAVLVTTTLAVAGNGGIQINTGVEINRGTLQLGKFASCMVAGTPSEFPDDIRFTNKSTVKLSAGTKIKWTVQGMDSGTYTLVADLAPGAHVLATNQNAGIEAGRDCKAKVL